MSQFVDIFDFQKAAPELHCPCLAGRERDSDMSFLGQQKAKAHIQRQDEEEAYAESWCRSLANHVTIDEIVLMHGSAKGRETNT